MIQIKAGATDQTIYLFIQDSSSSTGAGLTGLAYNTASLAAYYVKERGSATQITLATLAAANSAHADGGFKEVDATNMPGVYRLDLPDAAVSSTTEVIVMMKGATNMAPVAKEIHVVAYDPQSATNLGLSKFTDIETDTQDIQSRLPASLVSGRIDASVGAMAANTLTASALATDAVMEIQSGLATSASIAALNNLSAAQVNAEVDTALSDVGLTTTVTGRIDVAISTRLASASYAAPDNASITGIKAKTDNLTFTVAGQVDANAESMNGAEILGNGTSGDLWRGE